MDGDSAAQRKSIFLSAILSGLTTTDAAKEADVTRKTPYNWAANDSAFKEKWDKARSGMQMVLEDALFERATEGWDEPVFYEGKQCGVKRKFSDAAATFLLRGLDPQKYAHHQINHDPLDAMNTEELIALNEQLEATIKGRSGPDGSSKTGDSS